MANGMRQILLLLVPATAAILVLSEPMVRLVYQRGEFDAGADRSGRHGALLVRLLAAVQRPLPAAHPDLLQPPAALGADRDLGRQPGGHGDRRAGALRAVRGRRDRRRDRDRDRGQRARPGDRPAPAARPARAGEARLDDDSRVAPLPRRSRGRATGSGRSSTRRSGGPGRPDRLAGRRPAAGAVVYAAAITLLRIPEAEQIWRLLRRRDA